MEANHSPWQALRTKATTGTCVVIFLLIISPYFLPGIPTPLFENYCNNWIEPLLICLVLGSILSVRGRHLALRAQKFWDLTALAIGFWLAGSSLWSIFQSHGLAISVTADLLYLQFYIFLMVALETSPQSPNPNPFEQRLRRYTVTGGTVLLLTSFGYFGLLPALLSPETYNSWEPAVVGSGVMDFYLLIRFTNYWRNTKNPLWQRNFGWLAAALALWTATDLLNAFWFYDRFLVLEIGTLWDLLWYAPYLVMALGAITTGAGRPDVKPETLTPNAPSEILRLPSTPLVAYAFSMPLVHGILVMLGFNSDPLRTARVILLFIEAVILAALIFRTHRIILQENFRLAREHVTLTNNLSDANRDLEMLVEYRTFELAAANGELANDLAERQVVTSQLIQAEQQIRALLAAMPEVLVRIGPYDLIQEVFRGKALVDPLNLADAVGQTLIDVLPDGHRQEVSEALAAARTGQCPQALTIATDNGEAESHCEIRCSNCGEGNLLILVRDITRRRALEMTLQQSQKMESLGLMAGGIAHDFNNLLTGILGNAQLAKEDAIAGSDMDQALASIEGNALRASKLTGNLLAYAGDAHITVEPLNMNSLVTELTGMMEAVIPRRVGLKLDLHQEPQWIAGNEAQITQILLNLIQNAKEAIGPNVGKITICLRPQTFPLAEMPKWFWGEELPPGPVVALEVFDTGCGIPPKVQQRIFDPFFTSKDKGRGLGLAAVLGIIIKHGGMLTLESAERQGTMFRILLPTAAPPSVLVEVPTANPEPTARGKILVVDDEPEVRQMVVTYLQRKGMQTLEAENGAVGVTLFREHRDDLDAVVMDFSMPVMNGAQALEIIRKEAPRLPIVMISGYGDQKELEALAHELFTKFLPKPFNLEELGRNLDAICHGAQQTKG